MSDWMADALYMGTYLSADPSNKDASLEKMAFASSEQYSILNPPASNPASPENLTRKVPRGSNFGLLKVMMLSSQRLSLSTFIRLTSSSDAYLRQCDTRASLKLHGTNNGKKTTTATEEIPINLFLTPSPPQKKNYKCSFIKSFLDLASSSTQKGKQKKGNNSTLLVYDQFKLGYQIFRVGHLILRALTIRASNRQNALAWISFDSPKSLPPPGHSNHFSHLLF